MTYSQYPLTASDKTAAEEGIEQKGSSYRAAAFMDLCTRDGRCPRL